MVFENILPPSNSTLKVSNLQKHEKGKKLKSISTQILIKLIFPDLLIHSHKVLKHLRSRMTEVEEFMEASMKLLDTLIYKNTNRFRKDKGFQGLKMTQKSVKKLKEMNIIQEIQKFRELLPLSSDVYKLNVLYLPTLPSLQYFQIVHLRAFELCQKIIGRCEHACNHLTYRIKLGHFWNWATYNLASVSRIWTLTQVLMVNLHLSYEFHSKLFSFIPQSSSGSHWSGSHLTFPPSLLQNEQLSETLRQLLDKSDFPAMEGAKKVSIVDTLVGEIVERNETEDEPKQKVTKNKQKLKVTRLLKTMKTKQDFKDFIESESKLRKECRKNAATKKLEQNEWKELKTTLKAKLKSSNMKELKQLLESKLI